MQILDLKKQLKPFYSPSSRAIELVDIPEYQFISINGAIEPGQGPGTSLLFQENLQAMYGAAYTLKFMFKKRPVDPLDYPVMALEGLWWVEDGHFDINIKDNWFYMVMILVPDVVKSSHFEDAIAQLRKKKGDQPGFNRLRLEKFAEGACIQTMHLGPYADEPATVARMDQYAAEHGLIKRGKHHEIYLGNPLKGDQSKLKTILRHPVEKNKEQ